MNATNGAQMNRCKCGKRISKHANVCKGCFSVRSRELRAEGLTVIAAGKCPCCAQGIHQNSAITGWWQCDGYGADGFRKANAKPCSWQLILPDEVLCNL